MTRPPGCPHPSTPACAYVPAPPPEFRWVQSALLLWAHACRAHADSARVGRPLPPTHSTLSTRTPGAAPPGMPPSPAGPGPRSSPFSQKDPYFSSTARPGWRCAAPRRPPRAPAAQRAGSRAPPARCPHPLQRRRRLCWRAAQRPIRAPPVRPRQEHIPPVFDRPLTGPPPPAGLCRRPRRRNDTCRPVLRLPPPPPTPHPQRRTPPPSVFPQVPPPALHARAAPAHILGAAPPQGVPNAGCSAHLNCTARVAGFLEPAPCPPWAPAPQPQCARGAAVAPRRALQPGAGTPAHSAAGVRECRTPHTPPPPKVSAWTAVPENLACARRRRRAQGPAGLCPAGPTAATPGAGKPPPPSPRVRAPRPRPALRARLRPAPLPHPRLNKARAPSCLPPLSWTRGPGSPLLPFPNPGPARAAALAAVRAAARGPRAAAGPATPTPNDAAPRGTEPIPRSPAAAPWPPPALGSLLSSTAAGAPLPGACAVIVSPHARQRPDGGERGGQVRAGMCMPARAGRPAGRLVQRRRRQPAERVGPERCDPGVPVAAARRRVGLGHDALGGGHGVAADGAGLPPGQGGGRGSTRERRAEGPEFPPKRSQNQAPAAPHSAPHAAPTLTGGEPLFPLIPAPLVCPARLWPQAWHASAAS
jgi:hypothetical protein